jgi:hypothetical protein
MSMKSSSATGPAPLKTVGRDMGISPDAVRMALIQAGVPRRPAVLAPRSDLDTDEVRRRHEAGESVYAIARTLGSTEYLVRKALERVGMDRRPWPSTRRPPP